MERMILVIEGSEKLNYHLRNCVYETIHTLHEYPKNFNVITEKEEDKPTDPLQRLFKQFDE